MHPSLIRKGDLSRRIKIVHIQLLPLMSGVQKVSLDEFSQLDPSRYERVVVCKCEGEFTENLEHIGVRVHLLPELERALSPIKDFRAYAALRDFFKKECPEIVHTHSSKTGVLGRLAAHSARVPKIVHTVHGFAFSSEPRRVVRAIYKFIERVSGKFTDKMVVLNESDAAIARESLGISSNRLVIIPNGVDVNTYAPADSDTRNRFRREIFSVESPDHVIIAMVGRLWQQKNPHCFVRAAIQVLSTHSTARFFMIGDGEFRSDLESIIEAENLTEHIRIMGWRRDVPDLLKALDVMVLPSRWEGLPLAIIEAMSSGVPVVASDIPGNRHLINDGTDGQLFPLDDSSALATGLVELIDNPIKRASFSAQARSKVVAQFALSIRMDKIMRLYES
jgi:glycosyltransferase involved in cell wall biosynthesis